MSNSPTPAPAGTGTATPYAGQALDAAEMESILAEARYVAELRSTHRHGPTTEASWARSLLDVVATLTRQLAEAQQDTARLDWMERCDSFRFEDFVTDWHNGIKARVAIDEARGSVPTTPD